MEDLKLQVGELCGEDLGDAATTEQGVSLSQAEQSQDLLSSGPFAGALFRVQRQLLETFALHRQTQLAFDESLHQKGQEI